MTTAAIYARVSSARQRDEQTIGSQTVALIEAAERWGLEVPADWIFEDEGYSGATLVRPALERLRDLAAQVPVDVVLCYSPDRLARRYAYQALLIDEFSRSGTEVRFVKGPRAETPEDELMIQFQGMIAEYERAQIAERTRRGKAEIPVPAIVSTETFEAAARRLEDNRRFAARNTKVPSLLMGLVVCEGCGYAYYRTSTRTKTRKLYYYRCLGSDDYRYENGRVCDNRPVRADFLDEVVWGQVTALLADPALVQAELDRRLAELRTANPATAERSRIELELTRTTAAVTRLVEAYQEDLLSLDELRARLPALRTKETSLRASADALEAQLLDRDAYLKLAEDLEGFLARLRETSDDATVEDRQRVLRTVVKEVVVGPERVVVRHSIPTSARAEGSPGYPFRLRSPLTPAQQHRPLRPRRSLRRGMGGDGRHLGSSPEASAQRVGHLPPGAVCRRLRRRGVRHPCPRRGAA